MVGARTMNEGQGEMPQSARKLATDVSKLTHNHRKLKNAATMKILGGVIRENYNTIVKTRRACHVFKSAADLTIIFQKYILRIGGHREVRGLTPWTPSTPRRRIPPPRRPKHMGTKNYNIKTREI